MAVALLGLAVTACDSKVELPTDQGLTASTVNGSINGSFMVSRVVPSAVRPGGILTIEGTGLSEDVIVEIGGKPATVVSREGDKIVSVEVPEGDAGMVEVALKKDSERSAMNLLRLSSDGGTILAGDGDLVCKGQSFYDVSGKRIDGTKNCEHKIADRSIKNEMLADGVVTQRVLGNGAVSADKIAAGAVGVAAINDMGCAANQMLKRNAAGDGWECSFDLISGAPSSVGTNEIQDNAVTTAKINADAVNGAKIADGSITGNDIQNGSIGVGKLAAGTAAISISGNAATANTALTAATATTVANDAITGAKIANNTITGADIQDTSIGLGKLAAGTAAISISGNAVTATTAGTATTVANDAITSAKIANGTIVGADIQDASIGLGKLAAGTAAISITGSAATADDALAIRGRDVATTAPNANDVLTWNGTEWEPLPTQGAAAYTDAMARTAVVFNTFDGATDHAPSQALMDTLLADKQNSIDATSSLQIANLETFGAEAIGIKPFFGAPGRMKFFAGNDTDFVGFQAPTNVTTSVTYVLPDADGADGEVLRTDGAGQLSWYEIAPTLDLNTNAQTICGDGEFLRGDDFATCVTASSIVTAGGGLVTESDPQVGAIGTSGKWCKSDGFQIVCDETAPTAAGDEDDPEVAALTNGGWCTSDGTVINCNEPTPSGGGGGVDPDVNQHAKDDLPVCGADEVLSNVTGSGGVFVCVPNPDPKNSFVQTAGQSMTTDWLLAPAAGSLSIMNNARARGITVDNTGLVSVGNNGANTTQLSVVGQARMGSTNTNYLPGGAGSKSFGPYNLILDSSGTSSIAFHDHDPVLTSVRVGAITYGNGLFTIGGQSGWNTTDVVFPAYVRVGGSTAPTTQLDVSGTMQADKIRVKCPTGFTSIENTHRQLGCMQDAEQGVNDCKAAITSCFTNFGGRLPTYEESLIALSATFTNVGQQGEDDEWVSGAGYDRDCNTCGYVDSVRYCSVIKANSDPSGTDMDANVAYRCFIAP